MVNDLKTDLWRQFFSWLGHSIVEVRVIDPTVHKVVYQDPSITDSDRFAEVCSRFNGQAQVYFSLQGRDGQGGKYGNVPFADFFAVDIDAVRVNKRTQPATSKQRANAFRNADKILKYLEKQGVRPNLMVDTGNGILILVKIPRMETKEYSYTIGEELRSKISDKINAFYEEVRSLCDKTVEIDSVGDLPRVLGVPGTINVKGSRARKIIKGIDALKEQPSPQPRMWQLIEAYSRIPPSEMQIHQRTELTLTFDGLTSMLPEKLQKDFRNPEKVNDRSLTLIKAMRYFANKMRFTREECLRAMDILTRQIGRDRWPAAQQFNREVKMGKIKPFKSLKPEEILESELAKHRSTFLHPVIDYHPQVGLALGLPLKEHCKSLLLLDEKAFIIDFETPLLKDKFPNSLYVIQPRFASVNKVDSYQLLILAGELLKGKKINFPSKIDAFEKVFEGITHYWYHSDGRYYTFVTCWIISTYVYPIFVFFPALRLQGERQTGKTTLLDILHYLAWNPTGLEVAIRSADLFRTISDSRVTYLVDITKLSSKSEQYYDIIDIFEAGTEQDGSVRRIQKETGQPVNFNIYGPKAIATRYNLPFDAKTIGIITEKAKGKIYARRRARIKSDPALPEIVGTLIRAAIKYWPEIVEAYQNMEQTDRLVGRRFNYWSPILAVCKVFAPEKYDELLSLAEEDAEKNEKGDLLSEVEDAILAILVNYEGDKNRTTTILLKDLTNKIINVVPWVKSWHVVKSALRNLRINKRYYKSSKGVTCEIDLKVAQTKAMERNIESNRNAVLTQENIELVFRALHKETRNKEYAATQELVNATKLSPKELSEILGALQREGRAVQPRPDFWRIT